MKGELHQACLENRKSTEVMENEQFDCGRKNYYFQNFNNTQHNTCFHSH